MKNEFETIPEFIDIVLRKQPNGKFTPLIVTDNETKAFDCYKANEERGDNVGLVRYRLRLDEISY